MGGLTIILPLEAGYLSVFKISYTLLLKDNTTKAGFVFGANDRRFFNKNYNIYNIKNKKNEGYVKIELDISPIAKNSRKYALLNIYRSGYKPGDNAKKPVASFTVPHSIINKNNMYAQHHFHIHSMFGLLNIYMDGEGEEHKITQVEKPMFPFIPVGVNINPVGKGGDYICYIMLNHIGFAMEKGQKALFSNVKVYNYRSPSNMLFFEELQNQEYQGIYHRFLNDSAFSINRNGYEVNGLDKGQFIVADPSHSAMPLLRAKFTLKNKTVKSARLYATSRGIYKIFVNGKRVGDDYFNPGLSQYNKTQYYQTYDVSTLLEEGDNAIGAILGEGWWSGNATFNGKCWNLFGDRQSLLAKLIIRYTDETVDTLSTDTENWKCYTDGPLRCGSFLQGEVYDFRKEEKINGWSMPGFDDSKWEKATDCTHAGLHFSNQDDMLFGLTPVNSYDSTKFIGQIGSTVKVVAELEAISYEEVRPGVFVYDMGQNMVGFPQVKLKAGARGDSVTLRYAEVRYPDMEEYRDNAGMIMLENIRGALAQDIFVLNGEECMLQPDFTFHGYRYLEITGIDQALPLENVKGKVISSVNSLASHYETSDSLINKLWENITWSFRGNFLSIPTDCPQRNERMGWSGDLGVFCKTASYLSNMPQFFNRQLIALRDNQRKDGRFPDIAPLGGGFGGILWGSAGIILPWENYLQYNDIEALAQHYPSMKKYISFLMEEIGENDVMIKGVLGDWLSLEYAEEDNFLLYEAYFANNLKILSKVAKVLGRQEDEEYYNSIFEKRKQLFNQTFIDPVSKKTIVGVGPNRNKPIDKQTSYAVPLAFNLFDESIIKIEQENLRRTVTRDNIDLSGVKRPPYALMTGFIGTQCISNALSDAGFVKEAYRQLENEQYPSWLYPVTQGATTIWERLNSYTKDNGFGGNNSMNSFNHYSFGSVGEWLYTHSLGIQRDENYPGFKHFILAPEIDPTGKLTFAKGFYNSLYGKIKSEWRVKDDKILYEFSIPANTTATIYLPLFNHITENNTSIYDCNYLNIKGIENNKMMIEVKSGNYRFELPKSGSSIEYEQF